MSAGPRINLMGRDSAKVLVFILLAVSLYLALRLPNLERWSEPEYDEWLLYLKGRYMATIGERTPPINSYMYVTAFQFTAIFDGLFRDFASPLVRGRLQTVALTVLSFCFFSLFALRGRLLSRRYAFLAALFFLFLPAHFFLSGRASLIETVVLLFITMFLYFWMLYSRRRSAVFLACLAYVAGLGVATKLLFLHFLIPFLACALIFGEFRFFTRRRIAIVLVFFLLGALQLFFYLDVLLKLPSYVPQEAYSIMGAWSDRAAQLTDLPGYFVPRAGDWGTFFVLGVPLNIVRILKSLGLLADLAFLVFLVGVICSGSFPRPLRFLAALFVFNVELLFFPMPGPKIYQVMTVFPLASLLIFLLLERLGALRAGIAIVAASIVICGLFGLLLELPISFWRERSYVEDSAFYFSENPVAGKVTFLVEDASIYFEERSGLARPIDEPPVYDDWTWRTVLDPSWKGRMAALQGGQLLYIRRSLFDQSGEAGNWTVIKETEQGHLLVLGPSVADVRPET